MPERYCRQTLVPQIGEQGQIELGKARVLLVGIGGLGCHVATHLAGAGIGEILLVDHDRVSLSNLHRQILFRETDLGKNKAAVAAQALQNINSEILIEHLDQRVGPDSVTDLVSGCDVVIDSADNFATSYLLSDQCQQQTIPLISASVNQTFGFVGGFCAGAPSYQAAFPRLPMNATRCDQVGVTGPSVGIIGGAQAQEAIKTIIADEFVGGQLQYFDLWDYRTHQVDFSLAQEPAQPISLIGASKIQHQDIVIDVRAADEVNTSPPAFRIDRNIPLPSLLDQSVKVAKTDQRLVFACQSGQRAILAAQWALKSSQQRCAVLLPD